MPSEEFLWDVAIEEPNDPGQPRGDTDEIIVVKKMEAEARQAFMEAVSMAERLGYRSVRLRKDGVAVDGWPVSVKQG